MGLSWTDWGKPAEMCKLTQGSGADNSNLCRGRHLFDLIPLPVQIGAKLDEAEFTKRVVPCISKLFASNDRTIRRSLLESTDTYGKFLTQVRHSCFL